MKMINIEQMQAAELREILYKFYDILEHVIDEDSTLNPENALALIVDALDMADEDHESAKLAIMFYSDLTMRLGKDLQLLTMENISLKKEAEISRQKSSLVPTPSMVFKDSTITRGRNPLSSK